MASPCSTANEADTGTSLEKSPDVEPTRTNESQGPYSIFTKSQKRYIVFSASWAGFFSPVSSQIYFPALNSIADDLGVTSALINLTLTSYMVGFSRMQPFVANKADLPRALPHVRRGLCR